MRDFDELYAYRLQYQDYNEDENYIIKRLKILLYNDGENMIDINHHIYNFYNHYNINNITLQHIESISIYENLNINQLFQSMLQTINHFQLNENNNEDSSDFLNNIFNNTTTILEENDQEYTNNSSTIYRNGFWFSTGYSYVPQQEDIPVTLNEEDYDNLNIKNYTCSENNNCSICLCDMEKDDEYYEIKCNHYFHKDCLDTWITDYSYICPVCRKEIGKSQAHIDE